MTFFPIIVFLPESRGLAFYDTPEKIPNATPIIIIKTNATEADFNLVLAYRRVNEARS